MELPETSLVAAFEAVARHRSFRAAADELHLTPSAISHRIRTLEAALGCPLFARTTRSVTLTTPGEAFLPAAQEVLATLSAACRELAGAAHPVVTITTTDSVATCWLIDRLAAVADLVPGVEVRVLTTPAGVRFDPSSTELAVDYGSPGDWPSGDPVVVATERVTPVCSPAFAAQHPLATVDDLAGPALLGDQNLVVDWAAFVARTGGSAATVDGLRLATTYNHSHLALRAAAAGHGLALASAPLADDALARGSWLRRCRRSSCRRGGSMRWSRATSGPGWYPLADRPGARRTSCVQLGTTPRGWSATRS
ncbi:MAG: LysR family transcriptional regulator [Actinomycetota bacterium]|nr:LysR family transcriptional regulator [Actinomycetota bacterium]